jgi:hypothetical protein
MPVLGMRSKSRAANTIIENSRITDGPNGTASYSIDLPNGGNARNDNDVIEQGPNTDNPIIVAYGEEGSVYASSSLAITGNQIFNDLSSPSARGLNNATAVTAQITGNQFFGLTSGQIATGPNFQSNNTFLTIEPALDTSHPWAGSSPINPPPNNPAPDNPAPDSPTHTLPPVATTGDMILSHPSDGHYEIYNMGNNSILAADLLGQVGTDYHFGGLGNFAGPTTTGIILRSSITGNFQAYDISDNSVVLATSLGAVGSNLQLAGFGRFNGPGATTDMMLRDGNTGTFELYDINNNIITGATAIGAVGLDWQVQGFGDFNGDGTDDMMLRNKSTGTFETYDIKGGSTRLVSCDGGCR